MPRAKRNANAAPAVEPTPTPPPTSPPPTSGPGPLGVVGPLPVITPLDAVVPNPWNPNRMSEAMYKSFMETLRTEGWVASQALLIWRTDERGKPPPGGKPMIIDGEHRWKGAIEIGMTEGPMVFLDRLPADRAKAWTIKLDRKRGDFDDVALASLVAEIQRETESTTLAEELGFSEDEMAKMLAAADSIAEPGTDPSFLDGEEGGAEGDEAPESGKRVFRDGYLEVAFKLLPAEDDLLDLALRDIKRAKDLETRKDALVAMARTYLESQGIKA